MAYRLFYGTQILFDPIMGDAISDAKLTATMNNPDYLDFTIAVTHTLYNTVAERASTVELYFDDVKLFSGIITSIDIDMEGNKAISCDGALAYLQDTLVRPYSTVAGEQDLTAPSSVDGIFQWYIDQHNANALNSGKDFIVGINQGAYLDSNNYIYRSSEQLPTTWSELNSKILDELGGYIFLEYGENQLTLNLYADVHDQNTQIIDFGVNITDFTKTVDTDDQYTAVRPSGKTPESSGSSDKQHPITIKSLPDGGTDYSSTIKKLGDVVYDVDAVARYGYREYAYSNSDIDTQSGLLESACKALNKLLSPVTKITVKAVDLALYMDGYEHLKVGQAVRVRSKLHDEDEYLMIQSITLDLNNPGNTEYELGASYDTLTGQQSSYLKSLNTSINKSLDSVAALDLATKDAAASAEEAKKDASDAATKADSASEKANTAAEQVAKNKEQVEEAVKKANDAEEKANSASTAANEAKESSTAASTAAEEARKSANAATKAADDATAKVTLIEGNIAEIKATADDAKDAASKAQTSADAAADAASKVGEKVDSVTTQVANISDEMETVKADAEKTRSDLTEQIKTVTDTMTADYAKKTELTETEANLKTEISKSAAGVLSEVSSTYSTKTELDKTTATAEDAKAKAEANTTDLANAVSKFDKDVSDLQTQIDGSIQTWFYDGEPSATTEPESEWTSDEVKNTHLGDLYYDNETGFCYRYLVTDGVYSWSKIQDTEVTKALADAAAAQKTANSKKRIFVVQPTPPYDEGDLWVQGESGEILRCNVAKIEGQEYAETDWGKASKYTDDSSVIELANTVEKTYATKSSMTQLSDRIEQTVSAVETVKVDAAAAQATADEAAKAAATAKENAATAKENAATAQGKADAAITAAKTAQDAADTAKSDASAAQTAADTAKQAAKDAQTAATAAQEKANTAAADAKTANDDLAVAKKNLEAVQNQANATDTQVAAAQAAVVKAQNAADKANKAASTAQDAADAAKETAANAKTNADAAQETANAAKESAVSAATKAEAAKTDAAAAQATADTANATAASAVTNAANAQADADKANAAIADLADRVTTAETQITQNSEEIALKASKTELNEGVADAKSYADSQLSVKAGEITASVKETYATKDALAQTDANVTTAQSTANTAKTNAATAQSGVDTLESLVRVSGEGVEVAKKVNGAYTSSKAVVTDSTFSIVAKDGTELASYGKDKVYLGKNSTNALIDLCNSSGQISVGKYGLDGVLDVAASGGVGIWDTASTTPQAHVTVANSDVEIYSNSNSYDGGVLIQTNNASANESLIHLMGGANGIRVISTGALNLSSTTTVNLSAKNGVKAGVATTYTYSIPNMSGSGKWLKLGWWSGSSDSNSLVIELYSGNGHNGGVYQNTVARIMVKNGYQSTPSQAVGAFAGTLEIVSGTGTDASGMKLALPASSHNSVDVYVYMPWQYTAGWMQVTCNGGTWNADVKEGSYPTSGYTLQNVGYTAPVVSGLYWSGTLLGGRVGVKLWSGTLNKGGSITVSDLNRYRVLFCRISVRPEYLIGIRTTEHGYLTFYSSWDDGGSSYLGKVTGTISNDTKFTLTSASYHKMDAACSGYTCSVQQIWGLI